MGLSADRARSIRRGFPIHAYIGANGSGKTACMIFDTLPSLAAGRRVLSTVRLLDYENRRLCPDVDCDHEVYGGTPWRPGTADSARPVTCWAAHPLWVPWSNWDQLVEARDMDVLGDEMTGIAGSTDWQLVPARARDTIMQLRRRGVAFRWSVPFWASCVADVKRVTQAATVCTGFFPLDQHGEGGSWRVNRWFRWLTFDARELDSVEQDEKRRAKLRRLTWSVKWGPGSEMFDAYSTLDEVSSLASERACQVCGNRKRPEPLCSCKPDELVPLVARRAA